MASNFAKYKPRGLSRVGCNVGGLLQVLKKAENNYRSQGSASVYLDNLPQGPIDKAVKDFSIKRLKACVGAWSWRWALQTFTLTMKFWHLIVS